MRKVIVHENRAARVAELDCVGAVPNLWRWLRVSRRYRPSAAPAREPLRGQVVPGQIGSLRPCDHRPEG